MKNHFWLNWTALFLVAMITHAPALAITPLVDKGHITYDPNTGLEWLDLEFTAGKSYDSIQRGWHGYIGSENFRFATRGELLQLWTNAGATGTLFEWSPSNAAPASHLLSLIGGTLLLKDLDRSWLFYDASTEPLLPDSFYVPSAVLGLERSPDGEKGNFSVPGVFEWLHYESPHLASALVRVVPEPSVLMLLIAALGVELFATQKRR